MSNGIDKPTLKMDRFARRQPIKASSLNKMAEGIERISQGIRPGQQVLGGGSLAGETIPIQIRQFKIKSESGDYLICEHRSKGVDGGESIFIAKPYLLRRTPFDDLTRNSITYDYTSDTQRTATKGSDSETQVVVPSYVVGDIIYAVRGVLGGVGTNVTIAEIDTPLDWLDINADGRAWAKIA